MHWKLTVSWVWFIFLGWLTLYVVSHQSAWRLSLIYERMKRWLHHVWTCRNGNLGGRNSRRSAPLFLNEVSWSLRACEERLKGGKLWDRLYGVSLLHILFILTFFFSFYFQVDLCGQEVFLNLKASRPWSIPLLGSCYLWFFSLVTPRSPWRPLCRRWPSNWLCLHKKLVLSHWILAILERIASMKWFPPWSAPCAAYSASSTASLVRVTTVFVYIFTDNCQLTWA